MSLSPSASLRAACVLLAGLFAGGIAHAQTAPYALRRLYEGHVATLATYGLTELAAQSPESVSVPHTPVTAEHVTMAAAKGARTLRVPQCAVVTPLAQEAAAGHNMTILKNL